jgi:DNA polymerase-3 subunit chi
LCRIAGWAPAKAHWPRRRWCSPSRRASSPHHGVLVNLGQGIPAEFERFERFIEVVARTDDDRLAARSRWKHYTDRGYAMKRHDLATAGEGA